VHGVLEKWTLVDAEPASFGGKKGTDAFSNPSVIVPILGYLIDAADQISVSLSENSTISVSIWHKIEIKKVFFMGEEA
jgi:hypothetical protein